jgi:carboxymethylenebutenolidase
VVVIHEWWGVDDGIKDQARALAAEGYLALAVDLYRGKVTHDEAEAHQYMMGLSADRALRDLRAAVSYLKRRSDVRRGRIGAIGWSMGGRYALDLATAEPALAAVVVYYGALPTDPAAIARIRAPVLGHFGGDDRGPSPDQATAFGAAMKRAGGSVDVELYEGAPHAFASRGNPWGGYREAAARDAWARTVTFFAKTLRK